MVKKKEETPQEGTLATAQDFPLNDLSILADYFGAKSYSLREYALAALNVGRWLALNFLPDTGAINCPCPDASAELATDEDKKAFLESCCDPNMPRGSFNWTLVMSLVLEVLQKLFK